MAHGPQQLPGQRARRDNRGTAGHCQQRRSFRGARIYGVVLSLGQRASRALTAVKGPGCLPRALASETGCPLCPLTDNRERLAQRSRGSCLRRNDGLGPKLKCDGPGYLPSPGPDRFRVYPVAAPPVMLALGGALPYPEVSWADYGTWPVGQPVRRPVSQSARRKPRKTVKGRCGCGPFR